MVDPGSAADRSANWLSILGLALRSPRCAPASDFVHIRCDIS